MQAPLAVQFRADLNAIYADLLKVPLELADTPWREGGWTRKQIVGHLLDSASNNRHRLVGAAIAGEYTGPQYGQQSWVDAHGYAEQPWQTLLQWWKTEHDILGAVVDRIPEERYESKCVVGTDSPVTLRFLIEDYVSHQRWHLAQLTAGQTAV
jgi:DinB superfamily